MKRFFTLALCLGALAAAIVVTQIFVRRAHKPGQLDVLTAQAMDMSQMRPPTGLARVTLAAAKSGSVGNSVTYTGSVAAFNEQEISARVTGRVLSLSVYPGDNVRAGQILARLDTAELAAKTASDAGALAKAREEAIHAQHGVAQAKSDIAEADARVQSARELVPMAQAEIDAARQNAQAARADITAAQAQADYWRVELAREKTLLDTGAASRQEYQSEVAQAQAARSAVLAAAAKARQADAMVTQARVKAAQARREIAVAQAAKRAASAALLTATGEVSVADAQVGASQSQLRGAQVVQGYTQIAAPFDGVVTARPVAPGTLVQPGQMLLKMAQLDKVRLQANVAASDAAQISVGTPVTATVGGKTFSARVSSVFPSANSQTRTAVVEAIVPNPGDKIQPGAFVSLRFSLPASTPDATLVPASSVVSSGGSTFVWRVSGGAATSQYECQKCHMTYSAADAKKHNFIDPMDGGKLMPVVNKNAKAPTEMTAEKVDVTPGASDGNWTAVTGKIAPGDQIVTRGMANLSVGASVQSQDSTVAQSHPKRFKATGCGLVYSAADAKKYNYVCPMDGSKLVEEKS